MRLKKQGRDQPEVWANKKGACAEVGVGVCERSYPVSSALLIADPIYIQWWLYSAQIKIFTMPSCLVTTELSSHFYTYQGEQCS